MPFPPVEEQLAIIRRGVESIVPEEQLAGKLKQSLQSNQPLRVKYGIDPTGIDVHLGHTVPLRKMRQFQELGHQAVIIIGNATAMVGDPSGLDEARKKRLTEEQVEANARDYLEQVGKIVDLSAAEVHRNGDWFGTMSFANVLELCSKTTIAQLLVRENFAKRMKEEKPIFLLECLYPVMQAFDSVVIGADIELGGTEQLYNFMLARDLQKEKSTCSFAEGWMPDVVRTRLSSPSTPDSQPATLPQQVGVMSPILVGLDGKKRMGKSLGNYIGISESPYEMMKKFMQLPDDCMQMYYELLTDVPLEEVNTLLAGHPKEAKVTLAKAVIGEYHDAEQAVEAADRWQREIGAGAKPADIPTVEISRSELTDGNIPAAPLLKLAGLASSSSEARRSIQQGSAKRGEDKTRIESHDEQITVETGLLLWVGKKKFCRVELVD